MLKQFLFVLVFIFFFVFASKLEAQNILKDDKIPDNLIISLDVKSTNRPKGTDYILTISADGVWNFNSKDSFLKKGTSIQGKVEKNRIKELIAEFIKIDFVNLKDIYGSANNKPCINHENIEIISITLGKKSKRVSNYLGCSGTVESYLAHLGEKIRKFTIEEYKNKEK